MKDQAKLIYSNYDPETGISIARIQTPHGTFKGKARVHPNDINIASHYAGCKYAEIRAYIRYYKFLAKLKQSAIEEIKKLYNKFYDSFDTPNKVLYWTKDAINDLTKEKEEYLATAAEYQKDLKLLIDQRDEILKKINKAKNN